MKRNTGPGRSRRAVLGAVAGVLCAAASAWGQGRTISSRVSFSRLGDPGRGLGGRVGAWSPGIGSLSTFGRESGPLQSSLQRGGLGRFRNLASSRTEFRVPRGHGGVPAPAIPPPRRRAPMVSRRVYTPHAGLAVDKPGRPAGDGHLPPGEPDVPRTTVPSEMAGPSVLTVTADYLSAIGAAPATSLTSSAGPVETLVPSERGVYGQYMARGEAAFRKGNYAEAFDEFRIAHDAGEGAVESLLGLAHARIAVAEGSYSVASLYLQRALRVLPELPLVPLKPAKLFADFEEYRRRVVRLEKYLQTRSHDVDAQIVAAYLAWFDGRIDAAEDALRQARRDRLRQITATAGAKAAAADPVLDALDIFQRGMAAAGAQRLGTIPLPDLPPTSPVP